MCVSADCLRPVHGNSSVSAIFWGFAVMGRVHEEHKQRVGPLNKDLRPRKAP